MPSSHPSMGPKVALKAGICLAEIRERPSTINRLDAGVLHNDEEEKMAGAIKIMRRDALRSMGLAIISLPLVAVPGLWVSREANAQQKLPKEPVKYQDKPKDNQQCSGCIHFVPPSSCKLVQGEISPKGWCTLFAAKQRQ